MKRCIVFLLALLLASASFASTMAVNASAALAGSFGLEITTDGNTDSVFVQDDTPDGETTYRASFLLNPNDLLFAVNKDKQAIFKIIDTDDPTDKNWVRVQLRRNGAGTLVMNLQVLNDNEQWRAVGETTVPFNTKEYVIEVQQGSPGIGRLWKNGSLKKERLDQNMTERVVDRVRFGAPGAGEAATTGSYYLDEFASFRTLLP